MPIDKKDIKSSLISKGFKKKEKNTHTHLIYHDDGGKKTPVYTFISRGSYKEVDDKRVSDMAKQCRLSNTDFVQLVECSLSREDYDQHLRSIKAIG